MGEMSPGVDAYGGGGPKRGRTLPGAVVGLCGVALAVMNQWCVIPLSTTNITMDAGEFIDVGSAAPPGKWANVTANLVDVPSYCGTLTAVFAKPDEDLLIAGVSQIGIFGSRNGGMSWDQLGVNSDAGSDSGSDAGQILNRMSAIVYDPADSKRFWESGLYNFSPFVTNDDGATWTELGDIGDSDLVSVDFSDTSRQTLVAGSHEGAAVSPETLWRSMDGGKTWSNIGTALPENTTCTYPIVFDAQTYLVGCNGYAGESGILRTTDGAKTWTKMTASGGGAAPLLASDGKTVYWASPNNGALAKSQDQGKTWIDVVGAGVVATSRPIELPNGSIAMMGTTYILVSADGGATWKPASPAFLPPAATDEALVGLAYSSQRKTFYVWRNICSNFSGTEPMAPDAIESYYYGNEED